MEQITQTAIALTEDAGRIVSETWPEIITAKDYDVAALARKDAKGKIKELTNERLNITRPMDTAKKNVMAFFSPPLKALEDFVAIVDRPMVTYAKKQEEARLAEERKLQEEAEKKAEEERVEAETLANEMAESGDKELAAEIRESVAEIAVEVAPATIAPVKAQGTSTRTTTKIACTDKVALAKAISSGDIPDRLIDINNAMLDRYFKATGIIPPGCETSEKTIIVSR